VAAGKRPPAKPRKKKQNPAVPASERVSPAQPVADGPPDPDFKVLTVEQIKELTGKPADRPQDRGPQPPEPGDAVSPTLT
jgi:hypothetical protein